MILKNKLHYKHGSKTSKRLRNLNVHTTKDLYLQHINNYIPKKNPIKKLGKGSGHAITKKQTAIANKHMKR